MTEIVINGMKKLNLGLKLLEFKNVLNLFRFKHRTHWHRRTGRYWGSTTNVNLGTALEEAIVGSADVVFSSADVTLTFSQSNATQAARHLRLNLTGTSGGARQLILGSGCQIDKPYIINNGLADTVTVKNTTGTGIAVPAGKSMWVYNNGTNVVSNHMTP
jgi:hypothetical protein